MSDQFWILYDPTNKMQTDKLTYEQLQLILMKMKMTEIDHFLIWQTNWEKWKKLNDFINSDDSPFMNTFQNTTDMDKKNNESLIASVKMKPIDNVTEKSIKASFSNVQLEEIKLSDILSHGQQIFDGEQLNNEKSEQKPDFDFKGLNKINALLKSSKNDKYKLELLLIHPKGSIFRTIAKDISLSGTFCERNVPDEFYHSIFDLVIINNFISDTHHNRLNLKAKVIVTDSSIYIEYINATDEQREKLRAMLDYYVRSIKKIKT